MLLEKSILSGNDTEEIAKFLLGKILITKIDGIETSGIITETEAYKAPHDKASHAYGNKLTPRTRVMFKQAGHLYVYLCYGLHHLTNIVTGPEGTAHAILLRSIEPLNGMDVMKDRRNFENETKNISAGPGSLSKAMGLDISYSGYDMYQEHSVVKIEDQGIYLNSHQIVSAKRIGIDYAQEWAAIPWRFYIKDSKWVSKK